MISVDTKVAHDVTTPTAEYKVEFTVEAGSRAEALTRAYMAIEEAERVWGDSVLEVRLVD